LTNAFGQLDVVLNVDTNGQQLRSVSATMTCPGPTTMTQSQTISAASSSVAAEAAVAPITLSFNTALFNATTGAPTLRNGQCSLAATATTGATGSTQTQTATTNQGLVLNNLDGVVISESFAAYSNAEGVTTKTSAVDGGGLPWKGGAPTISALVVAYSGRTIVNGGSVTITLPGASGATQTISPTAAGSVTATWSATSTSVPNVVRLTLSCNVNAVTGITAAQCAPPPTGAIFPNEANGTTPLGIVPGVIALDVNGNDLGLVVLNFTQPALNLPNPGFRLDNTPPQPPTTLMIEPRRGQWANAAYTFTGTGVNGGLVPPTGSTKYISCGDGYGNKSQNPPLCSQNDANPTVNGVSPGAAYPQVGVSAGSISNNSGQNGLTTFSYYAIPAASYPGAPSATNGTGNTATACATTGFTKITTAGDLAETLGNTAYIVRVFESDALLNARCNDLAAGPNLINSGIFAVGKFGVDKTPPTAAYVDPGPNPPNSTAAGSNGQLGNGGVIGNFNIQIGLSDNASGFGSLPVTSFVTRLAVDPATALPSNAAGNFNNAFGCPSGLSQGACTTASTSQTIRGDANGMNNNANVAYVATGDAVPGAAAGSAANAACVGCGYFTYSQTPLDLARNAATTITGTTTPSISGASISGASGYRTVVIDYVQPTVGGIAVPASIVGGSSASFATSAIDNLDLVSSDYTLTYAANPVGNPAGGANLQIRAAGPGIGTAFDNVLTTSASFNLAVPFFIRNIATTTAAGAPQVNGFPPSQIDVRVYDAAGNGPVAPGTSAINPANVPQTNLTNFTVAPAGANPAATMIGFTVTNAVANISNCPAAGCAGNAPAANATTVTLTAAATGNEGANFQFLNPFTQVQFYYFDTVTGQYILIGTAVAPVVTDNNPPTIRTFTWTLSPAFDPPAALGAAITLKVVAVGVNALGDGLATPVNANITLTNP
jgi:hypothetical protein